MTVSTSTPDAVAVTGGETLTLSGSGFVTGLPYVVTFSGANPTPATFATAASITVVTPALTAGSYVITVMPNGVQPVSGSAALQVYRT